MTESGLIRKVKEGKKIEINSNMLISHLRGTPILNFMCCVLSFEPKKALFLIFKSFSCFLISVANHNV
jgi:hypothetical protein